MRPFLHVFTLLILISTTVYSNEVIDELPVKAEIATVQNPYVAISDIPDHANSTLIKLQEIETVLTESDTILEMNVVLPSYRESLQEMIDDPVYQHLDTLDVKTIDELYQKWLVYLKQLEEWQTILQARLALYDEHRVTLKAFTELWSETHIYANKQLAPETIQNKVATVLIKIETLNNSTKSNYDMLLTNSQLIANKLLEINLRMEQLKEAKSSRLSNIFIVDGAPIIALITTTPLNFTDYIRQGIDALKIFYQNLVIYFMTYLQNFYKLAGYTFVISIMIGYLYFLKYKGTLFTQGESVRNPQFAFINRPFSTIIVLGSFLAVFSLPERSAELKHFQLLILLIPMARLLANIVHQRLMPYIYAFFLLFITEFFTEGVTDYGLMDRLSALALTIAIFTIVCLAQRQKKFVDRADMSGLFKHSTKFSILLCALLAFSFFANLYGTVTLAESITKIVFTTLTAILMFYTLVNVLSGLLIIFIRRRIAHAPQILQTQSLKLERNVIGLLTLFTVFWWFLMMVNIFGAKEILLEWAASILAYSWQFGALTFSVEGIFNFIVILIVTWFIARLVRIVLTLDIFIRFKFPRGVPTAVSTISNHIIFVVGIVAALSTLGVTMQEFALIGGALGVGIGFGLRNIIANFVSGIIMLFERPVQIGDTIEVNKTMGKVQSIGSRATAIKTFDGSEVLIPNADFIASDVTNWTLSDERRRAVLLIKVDFDSDIEKVLEIMSSIAKVHEHVLDDPAPLAAFEGFGDYYLEFKLYYWLSDEIIPTKSDIAIGVFKSLIANGIKIPTPTRNIAIHNENSK